MDSLQTDRVLPGAPGAADRIKKLAQIAFGREVTRKVMDVILPLNDMGSGPAFYCVHGVTGSATDFRFLAEMLGPNQKFYGIQTPTAKRNAAFATSIEQVARFYVNRLNEFQPTGPLILGGHSVGAVIALEMAQQLRALGRDVRQLIIFDGELFNTGAEMSVVNPIYWGKLVLNVPGWIRNILMVKFTFRTFCRTASGKALARIRSAIAVLTGRRDGDGVEAMVDLRNFTADHAAFVKNLYESQFDYIPKPYPGSVVVCEAKTHPLTYLFQVEATWRKIAPAAEIVKFRGTHTSLVHPPDGLAVAAHLTGVFSQIERTEKGPAKPFRRSPTEKELIHR
jgi:thioesterase domain-containing protein